MSRLWPHYTFICLLVYNFSVLLLYSSLYSLFLSVFTNLLLFSFYLSFLYSYSLPYQLPLFILTTILFSLLAGLSETVMEVIVKYGCHLIYYMLHRFLFNLVLVIPLYFMLSCLFFFTIIGFNFIIFTKQMRRSDSKWDGWKYRSRRRCCTVFHDIVLYCIVVHCTLP